MKRLVLTVAAVALVTLGACSSSGGDNSTVSQPSRSSSPSSPSVSSSVGPPAPLRVMVTNDDGVAAPGIDAMVNALLQRKGVEVTVVAPADNQSGSGSKTTPGDVAAEQTQTASGYPATAVHGFPADAAVYGLTKVMTNKPDLVISGANAGQNLGPSIDLSGTVGAARAAAQHDVPALAVSAGLGDAGRPIDYAAAVAAAMQWLDQVGPGLTEPGVPAVVLNLNVPTCSAGAVRGTVEAAPDPSAALADALAPADCTSTTPQPATDVTAFHAGFATISDVPLQPAGG